jgi:hypothetical protein
MAQIELEKLVKYLRRRTSRTHVGLWLMPLDRVGYEADVAVHLDDVEALDIAMYLHNKIPKGADFVRLSAKKIIETLDSIASSLGQRDCVLVYNLDLLLSGIREEECQKVWQTMFNQLPGRARILILAIPKTADHLRPDESFLTEWKNDARLA